MIFNVGARRSGTFWLQRIVTSHPEVSAVPSETSLFSHGIAPLFERFHHGARSTARVGSIYLERETLLDATRDFCDVAFNSELEPGARYLAERTALHVRHIELIAEVYPDARFIHIIRDGRDVARSIVAQPWGPDTIAGAAEEWRSSVQDARKAGLPAERYREVRYEVLLEQPEPIIAGLFEWLDLPVTETVLEQALAEARTERNVDKHGLSGVARGKWEQAFTPEGLAEFHHVAGDLAAELGYATGEARGRQAKTRARSRDEARRLRQRLIGLARRRRNSSHGAWRDFYRRQSIADRALSALVTSRVQDLSALMAPDALVKIVSARGIEAQRGAASRELIDRTVAEDTLLAGHQVLGDMYPGDPTVGYVLSFRQDGGHPADRAIFITTGGGQVTELTIYQLPLGGG